MPRRTPRSNLVGEKRSAVGARLSYRYSNLEQITAIVDPNQNVSHYDYDLKERLVRVSRLGKVREEYVEADAILIMRQALPRSGVSPHGRTMPHPTDPRARVHAWT